MTGPALCGRPTRSGKACHRPAGWGTDHPGVGACKLHGGMSPSGKVHAARALADQSARAALARLGQPEPMTDPVRRLQLLAGEADLWLEVCRDQVAALDGDFAKLDNFGAEQVRAMVRQYTEAIDRLHRIGADLVRLNLEERARRLDEAQSALVWATIDRGLRDGLAAHGRPELYGPVRASIGRSARNLLEELEPATPATTLEDPTVEGQA